MSGPEFVQIKDLKVGMSKLNAVFIVLEVGPCTLTKEGREVRTLRVADAGASVNLSVWDAPGALLQPGDIVRISRGYTSLWRNALTLYCGKGGDIQKVGEFCMLFNEQVNMSEPQPLAPQSLLPVGAGAGPGAAGGAGGGAERTNGARAPPAPGAKPERYAGAAAGGGGDGKHQHKTYVRGRGPQRGASRR